ncbi:MAG: hypothetical protein KAH72_04575 [Flavobacteriaceae bacterium]|nr:hypothetical protein [Flavobacteriaceae bacterium]
MDSVKSLFNDSQVYSITELMQQLNCSAISVRKKLSQIGYYSSYTHNSRYYTLLSIPEFDQNHLWFYSDIILGEICFTRHKTLNLLLVSLIDASDKGLTEGELSGLIKTRAANQLLELCRKDKTRRIKIGREYYYLSFDNKRYSKQYEQLTASDAIRLSAEIALPKIDESLLIKVLFCVIDSFDISVKHIVNELKNNNVRISQRQVEIIMSKYELYEKKKPLSY